MKVLNYAGGTAAVRVIGDAVFPDYALPPKNLINYRVSKYSFAVFPQQIAVGQALPALAFQQGQIYLNDMVLAVDQLVVCPDGGVVATKDTDTADLILNNFMDDLDQSLGYRFKDVVPERLYASALAVEIGSEFIAKIEFLDTIQKMANAALGESAKGQPKLKKISFGFEEDIESSHTTLVGRFVAIDFSIERRAGVPFAKDVFFTAAPLSTRAHVKYLEELETKIAQGKR